MTEFALEESAASKDHKHEVTDINKLIDAIYPIGSIYTSTFDTDHGTLFGGTWISIENKFLYAAPTSESSKQTGGSKQITDSNLPAHTHTFKGNEITGDFDVRLFADNLSPIDTVTGCFRKYRWSCTGMKAEPALTTDTTKTYEEVMFAATQSGTISSTRSGTDYMPLYMTVYAWERTA